MEDIKGMSFDQFLAMIPSRARRSLKRGMDPSQKKVLEKIKKNKRKIKTHCRSMVIIPEMVDQEIEVYSGKEWVVVRVQPFMLGHTLGEFAPTRKRVGHNAPGVGATRSSASVSVR